MHSGELIYQFSSCHQRTAQDNLASGFSITPERRQQGQNIESSGESVDMITALPWWNHTKLYKQLVP